MLFRILCLMMLVACAHKQIETPVPALIVSSPLMEHNYRAHELIKKFGECDFARYRDRSGKWCVLHMRVHALPRQSRRNSPPMSASDTERALREYLRHTIRWVQEAYEEWRPQLTLLNRGWVVHPIPSHVVDPDWWRRAGEFGVRLEMWVVDPEGRELVRYRGYPELKE